VSQTNEILLFSFRELFSVQSGHVHQAQALFQSIDKKTIFMYGALFKGYVSNGLPDQVLELLDRMPMFPNPIVLTLVFNACAQLANGQGKETGRRLLQQMPRTFLHDDILVNAAIDMLMKLGDVDEAERLFQSLKKKSKFTFGAMMKGSLSEGEQRTPHSFVIGYVLNHQSEKALKLFETISVQLDQTLYVILYTACASLSNQRAIALGTKLFDAMPKSYVDDVAVITSAIHMFMRFGDVNKAELFFRSLKNKSPAIFGAMMKGYVMNHSPEKALHLFETIPFKLDRTLYVIVYSACASLQNDKVIALGTKLLNDMPKQYFNDTIVFNSALHMLMKLGRVTQAEQLYSRWKKPNIVTYGVMMNGYNLNHESVKCLALFDEVQQQRMPLNEPTSISLISACAQIGFISTCRRILPNIPSHLLHKSRVKNSLIDMWVSLN
jgi:pentatricopeptide repeat protein